MKTKYQRLLATFVSSVSMATTIGLSAEPGLSTDYGDICIHTPTGEQVVYLYEDEDGVYMYSILYEDYFTAPSSDISNCQTP